MNQRYENTIFYIQYLNIKMTRKQYDKFAERFHLINADRLQQIMNKSFDNIIKDLTE